MSKLYVNALRCVEETNELGNDSLYMVLFRGNIDASRSTPKVVGGSGTDWGSIGKDDYFGKDKRMLLDDAYDPGAVHVLMLLEQDYNRDILTGSTYARVSELWINGWMKMSSLAGGVELCALNAMVLGGGLDNDELIGMPQKIPQLYSTSGLGHLMVFEGNGGKYRVRVGLG